MTTIVAGGLLAVALLATLAYGFFERARLRDAADEVQRQRAIAAALMRIARRFVLASRESAGAVRERLDAALREYFVTLESVAIFDVGPDSLRCVYATGQRMRDYVGTELSKDSPMLPALAMRFEQLCTLDVPEAKPLHPGDRIAAAIPLALEAGTMSIVYVSCVPPLRGGWEPVEAVVEAAGPSYFVASERDEMLQQLTHDPMTALLNKNAFDLRLGEALARGAEVSVCYLDLDGFKGWNDAYGHQSGDLVLKQAAEILRTHVLSVHDLVARRGGDEFCMAFIGVPKSQAVERALEIGAVILHADRSEFIVGEDQQKRVTACIGVACAEDTAFALAKEKPGEDQPDRVVVRSLSPAAELSPIALVNRADLLMYHSKASGKDRVAYLLEDGTLQAICSSEYDRRDSESRPPADRRGGRRPFVGGQTPAETPSEVAR